MIVGNCRFSNVFEVPEGTEKLQAVLRWRVAQLMCAAGMSGEFGILTWKVKSQIGNRLRNLIDPSDLSIGKCRYHYPVVTILNDSGNVTTAKIDRLLRQNWLPKISDEIGERGIDSLYLDFVKNAMEVQEAQPKEVQEAQPKEEPKAQPKEVQEAQPKEVQETQPKEEPKAQPKEEPKAQPKEEPKAQPKEVQEAQPKEMPKPNGKSKPKKTSWVQSLFNWLLTPLFWLFS